MPNSIIKGGSMSDGDPQVYTIGIAEVYQELRGLGDKLTDFTNQQNINITSLGHELAELKRDHEDLKTEFKAEKIQRTTTSRQAFMAILTSFLLPLLVGVVLTILLNK